MRGAEEDEAKCRHIDGSIVLMVCHAQVIRVQQRALHQDAAQAVADPDNGVSKSAFALPVQSEVRNECLGMLVYEVVACAAVVLARVHIGVVPVDEDVGLDALEGLGQEIGRPEGAVAGGPCLFRVAVEAVDEDDVYLGVWVGVDG